MSMGLLKTRRFGPFFVTQFLGAFRIFPYRRVGEFPLYFFELFAFTSVVKDTPEA